MKCQHKYKPEWYNQWTKCWKCYVCEKCGKREWIKEDLDFNQKDNK